MHAQRRAWRLPRALAFVAALSAVGGCYSYSPYGRYPTNPGYYSSPPPGISSQPGVFTQPGYGFPQPGYGQPVVVPPGGMMPGGTMPGGYYPGPGTTLPPGTNFPPGTSYPPGTTLPPGGGFPTPPFPNDPTPFPGNPPSTYTPPMGPGDPIRRPNGPIPFEANPGPSGRVRDVPPPGNLDQPGSQPFSTNDPANFGGPGDQRRTLPPRGTVPRPVNPGSGPPRTFETEERPFGQEGADLGSPVKSDAAASAGRPLTAMADGPELQAPEETVVTAGAEFAKPIVAKPAAPADAYGYDRDGFAWIRGTVDYDGETGTWFLIYNLTPDEHDRHQGGLTLAAEPALIATLKHGDIVLAEGGVESQEGESGPATVFRAVKLTKQPLRR